MIGWLDLGCGVAGDMLMGALVDAGVPFDVVKRAVDGLGLPVSLTLERVTRAGLAAAKVHVVSEAQEPHRPWSTIDALLADLGHEGARQVFRHLAEAEAAVHGVEIDDVHFHEVGAHDALADVVGVTHALAYLGLTRLTASTVRLGGGTVRAAHGVLPVPVPAVLRLLEGLPVQGGPEERELTTPTGAALVRTLVDAHGPMPAMTVSATGYGAGTADLAQRPNVTRLVLGEPLLHIGNQSAETGLHSGRHSAEVWVVEATVDDLDPRVWPSVLAALLEAGAKDAHLTPVLGKKGRPGHVVTVLTDDWATAEQVLFAHTPTLGVRRHAVDRTVLARDWVTVDVEGQSIRVKRGFLPDGTVSVRQPEWEDVAAAASVLGRPTRWVLERAREA